jgi:hypothetical protein
MWKLKNTKLQSRIAITREWEGFGGVWEKGD